MSDYYYQNNSSGGGFLANIPVVTKNLIFINIIMFVATLINQDMMVRNFALFYPSSPFFRRSLPICLCTEASGTSSSICIRC